MAEDQTAEPPPPTFKRRKVMRKPNQEDDSNETPSGISRDANAAISEHDEEFRENGAGLVTRVSKKGGVKKLGIGFSSTGNGRTMRDEQPEEQALVVASDTGVSELPQNDRFVKPTGRVGVVTEDRHMYVSRFVKISLHAGAVLTA